MSQEITFSGKIKEELSRQRNAAGHCQIAETAAILSMCGRMSADRYGRETIKVRTENLSVARKYFTLLKKTFNINTEVFVSRNKSNGNVCYTVIIKKHEDIIRVLQALKLTGGRPETAGELSAVNHTVIRRSCCRRAFIRGAFLAAGSMSNPQKSYHMEIVCAAKEKAEQLKEMINSFDLDAKVIVRKKMYVVYLKEGSQIVDLLNVMEAPVGLMEMENVRILKEVRNSVNRKVNCETANISKTVSAAARQIEDIQYIQDTIGLGKLPEELQEIAQLRLEYPNETLKELGGLLSTPLGKSGVNHRLRKISRIVEDLKEH